MSRAAALLDERDTLLSLGYLYAEDLGDLRIYHYTDRCVRERAWNELTLNSRGHIWNRETGECVARPFTKFFNINEFPDLREDELPWHDVTLITEKVDGWMGTLFRDERGLLGIATSHAIRSAVAIMASEWLPAYLRELPDELTLVFEILSPASRVVIDYGPGRRLVLLAAFNRHTGEELDWPEVVHVALRFGFELPRCLWRADDQDPLPMQLMADEIQSRPPPSFEGYVVKFGGSKGGTPPFRVKIKSPAYQAALRQANRVRSKV